MKRHARILASLLLLLILHAAVVTAQQLSPPQFRLPDTARPMRYVLDLTLNPEEEVFAGKVAIELELKEPAATIWLHGNNLTVDSASIKSGSRTHPAKTSASAEDFLGFQVDTPLPAGPATLSVAYKGKISSKSTSGIFRNEDLGSWYIYTQFQAIDARSAFPCFDEPRFKTPWVVTLRVKKEHGAYANTTATEVLETGDGFKTVKFAETKPLPTYLVAFAVGPFEIVDVGKVGRKPTPLRIIVPRGRTTEAQWAVESTGPILAWLEDYFDLPYPYEKLDSIAVPLFGGAMENPGLITYGHSIILSKPDGDTVARQRLYADIAAHEIAHMWFGDLVTMSWWDEAWLSEGFATWLAGKTLVAWKPQWDAATGNTRGRIFGMNADSLISARKVRQPANTKSDISNAFDTITYQKAGAVIHMFEQWVGSEVFRRGVKRYIDSHAHGNATAADFLRAIGAAAGSEIAPAVSTFLDQPGVPQVAFELKCERRRPPALALSQKRHVPLGSPRPPEQTWQIPVCFEYGSASSSNRECALLTQTAAEVPIRGTRACPDWVLLNDEYNGYYRSRYTTDLLSAVLRDPSRLSASERLGLLRDAYALVRSGDVRYADALALASKFARDPNRQVVGTTVVIAASVELNMVPDELRANYVRFIQKTYGEQARALGWIAAAGEDDDQKLLRQSLVGLVARAGEDVALRQQASELARRWLDDRKAVSPDIAGLVLAVAAREGGRDLWERYLAAAKKATDEKERGELLTAMSQFRDAGIIKSNFELVTSQEFDAREAFDLVFAGSDDPKTRDLSYRYLTANYDDIASKMPTSSMFDLRSFLPYVAGGFCSAEKRAEVEAFFKGRMANVTGGPRVLAQVLEYIGQCDAIRTAQQAAVAEFLQGY